MIPSADPLRGISTDETLEGRISRIGRSLTAAVSEIIEELPPSARRPTDVSRAFKINKDLSSRLLIALGKRDPLAAAYYMPGPEALRKLIQTAGGKVTNPVALARLKAAVEEFELLVREHGGNRGALGAIISGWVPEARARFEMENKQAAFRAMANLRGCAAKTLVQAALVHPSQTPGRVDGLGIVGYAGLRRTRPGVPLHISTLRTGPGAEGEAPLSVAGEAIDAMSGDMLLREFCSTPTPEILVRPAGSVAHYLLAGDRVGLTGAIDLFLGEFTPRVFGFTQSSPGRRVSVTADIEICTEELVFDTLIHRDVWPGVDPELGVYDTSMLGRVNVNNRERDIDRMDLFETVVQLGHGVQSCRIEGVPRYVEMLRSVCAQRGWDPEAFRCYRCHVQYPVYATQIILSWLPPPP
ncbi:MAG TPA: hypothetical protein VEB22_08555 [Phycisphaerales bacterium]|nr:hypothetical protein [Phycisphaerales bacterium]